MTEPQYVPCRRQRDHVDHPAHLWPKANAAATKAMHRLVLDRVSCPGWPVKA